MMLEKPTAVRPTTPSRRFSPASPSPIIGSVLSGEVTPIEMVRV